MLHTVIGHSDEINTADAVAEIVANCRQQLMEKIPSAGLVFCGMEYDRELLIDLLHQSFPGVQLIGCTTDGEMSSELGFTEDAITLALFSSDKIEFSTGIGINAGSNPEQASFDAVTMARQRLSSSPCLAIALPDGLSASAHEVLGALGNSLGNDIPVVGGMSADRVGGAKTTYETYQFFGNQVYNDSVPILLFGGDLAYSIGLESGWSPLGTKMTVTRAEGQVLYELDGRPALELYTHYLGALNKEGISGLGAYPLAVFEPDSERYYLRVVKAIDPETGAVTFLGEIPEGAQVQIAQAVRNEVMSGVQRSVQMALDAYDGESPPSAGLLFSCTGRKLALGTKACEEINVARNAAASQIPMLGFYTFGELGPLTDYTRARYHNTTFVTLLMGSK